MKRNMSLKDAAALVPDDMPDGAYWAMAHEIAGADYGDAWDELEEDDAAPIKDVACKKCGKIFISEPAMKQHARDKHE